MLTVLESLGENRSQPRRSELKQERIFPARLFGRTILKCSKAQSTIPVLSLKTTKAHSWSFLPYILWSWLLHIVIWQLVRNWLLYVNGAVSDGPSDDHMQI